ncbi:MAG: hypothetical protein PHD46_05065 [Eubacteriales bacterium]|nr:hypothetical protein [Eubacteriales bacterium]MDD4422387.1 hypothetical protein [Eubacteriales bacterium]
MKIVKIDDNLLHLPDCLYLTERGKCEKLSIEDCQGEKCSFFQTPTENALQKQRWAEQLSSLDDCLQKKIAKKYYAGSMPWKEEAQNR